MQNKKNCILVVDDEEQIRKMLCILLDTSEFKVVESESGKQAVRMAASVKPDLILLDLGLPDMNGRDVVTAIRQWSQVPIIVQTVRSEDSEIAALLNSGADDYVTKPFSAEVLLARIYANLRRAAVQDAGEPDLMNGPLRMDLVRHEVYLKDQKLPLTPKEYDLLRYLMSNRGKMLTHKQILKEVWGPAHVLDTQYLRVYIGQLRDKLKACPGLDDIIVSESGVGYRMDNLDQDGAVLPIDNQDATEPARVAARG